MSEKQRVCGLCAGCGEIACGDVRSLDRVLGLGASAPWVRCRCGYEVPPRALGWRVYELFDVEGHTVGGVWAATELEALEVAELAVGVRFARAQA